LKKLLFNKLSNTCRLISLFKIFLF
jgi:hypothetical protein